MKAVRSRLMLVACFGALLLVGVAACGGGGSSSSGTATEASTGGSTEAAEGSAAGSSGEADFVAAAKEKVAPIVGRPSAFPTEESLKERPQGDTIAFMDCGLPYCALFWELLQQPAKMLGVHLERIKSGEAANTIGSAFDSVVAEKPSGVIVMANNIQLWSKQLKELQAANIPVVTQGVAEAEKYGIVSPQSDEAQNNFQGEMMANYIPAYMNPEADVVFYEVPELSYTGKTGEKFVEELEAVCPGCSVRTAKIPASTLGNTAPNEIVSDLQAHPETDVAVFADPEMSIGLPAAMTTAGVEVETLNNGPIPANLEQIKEGTETAGIGYDTAVGAWNLLDQMAREIAGQKLSGPQAEGLGVTQFLTQKDITFDPSKGWTGYPEFAERYAKLWGVEG